MYFKIFLKQAIQEAYRVLKPGGRFLCLEFSHVENPAISSIYETYSFEVIPPMGMVLAGDWDSYQYLIESIRRFPTQEDFRQKIKNAGFKVVSYENLTFGISAIHSGFKIQIFIPKYTLKIQYNKFRSPLIYQYWFILQNYKNLLTLT